MRELARAEGIDYPTEENLRRLDRNRQNKRVSKEQWESPTDPEARLAKMKDARTRLTYKSEHAVDLKSEAIVAAHANHADRARGKRGAETHVVPQANLVV